MRINRLIQLGLSYFLAFFFLFNLPISAYAADINDPLALLQDSQQMLLLITPSWKSDEGWIQRYERDKNKLGDWQKVGDPALIVIGKKGFAWSVYIPEEFTGPRKTEGDGKTPAGIFKIGPAFGFKKISQIKTKLSYIPVTKTTLCIDDPESNFYNKIVSQ